MKKILKFITVLSFLTTSLSFNAATASNYDRDYKPAPYNYGASAVVNYSNKTKTYISSYCFPNNNNPYSYPAVGALTCKELNNNNNGCKEAVAGMAKAFCDTNPFNVQ